MEFAIRNIKFRKVKIDKDRTFYISNKQYLGVLINNRFKAISKDWKIKSSDSSDK